MPSVAEFLFGTAFQSVRAVATRRTILACVGRINGDYLTESCAVSVTPGTFSLLREDRAEQGPGSIRNRLGEAVVAKHSLDIEFLNGDHAEAINKPPRCLVNEVMASISDTLVEARQNFIGLPALTASLLGLGLFAACFGKGLFITAEKARIVHKLAIGQSQKRVQSRVKTNGYLGRRQEIIFPLDREADKPLKSIPANRAGFDLAENGAMQFSLDLNRLALERQLDGGLANFEAASGIGNAVILVSSLESRIARRFACFDAAEECLKREINANGDVLQNLTMDGFEFGVAFLPQGS